jgi:hypothetical protein
MEPPGEMLRPGGYNDTQAPTCHHRSPHPGRRGEDLGRRTDRQLEPFIWTKTADQILETIAAYCGRIDDTALGGGGASHYRPIVIALVFLATVITAAT